MSLESTVAEPGTQGALNGAFMSDGFGEGQAARLPQLTSIRRQAD